MIKFDIIKSLIVLLLLTFQAVVADEAKPIFGNWYGVLSLGDNNELEIEFIIEDDAKNGISVVLNSSASASINNVPASAASYRDGMLVVEIKELNGSYEGQFNDGIIKGKWKQIDQVFPLSLEKAKPAISQERAKSLAGSWVGNIVLPNAQLTVVLTFEVGDNGDIKGQMLSPDQTPLPFKMDDIQIRGDRLSYNIKQYGAYFSGEFIGDSINGTWNASGQSFPLKVERGELDSDKYALNLPDAVKSDLAGLWHGDISTPIGKIALVYRFEKTDRGTLLGFFDSPDSGTTGIVVNQATLEGNKITIAAGTGSVLNGKLSANSIVGDYIYMGQTYEVALSKGILPSLPVLGITAGQVNKLLTTWEGELEVNNNKVPIALNFRMDKDDNLEGFINSSDLGLDKARIWFVTINNDNLMIRSSGLLKIEISGKISSSEINGAFSQGGESRKIKLKRIN